MKKSLIALAALAAVGAASAQSSVTLYGRLDLGSSYNKTTTTVGGVSSSVKTTSLAGAQGVRTGGRLGVRGTEDLGGGLKVNFNVETAVNPDRSTSGGFGTFGLTRTAILQLQGAFGSATIGTYLNVLDDVRGYSASTAGVAGGDFLVNTHALSGLSGRSQNSIGYRSPVFGGGFQAMIGTTHEKTDTGVLATTTKTTGYLGGVGYNNGPVSAILAGGQGKVQAAGVDAKSNDWGFAASYNLGMAVPYFQYEHSKLTSSLGAAATVKSNAWEIGSKFPMGAFTPYITLSRGKIKVGSPEVVTKARGYQLGTTYDLSKRTYVYAALGRDKTTVDVVGGAEVKRTGYALGLVHNF